MEVPEYIKESVKKSVGYIESENKESFMIGSEVAFDRAEHYFTRIIQDLQSQLDTYKKQYESVNDDMKTLTRIINKYDETE